MTKMNLFKNNILLPAVIQENKTGVVLMLGYMNKVAFNRTIKTGFVHFWSRSRNIIWKKGEISGNILQLKEIYTDCDNDTLLIKVKLIGNNVCHKGKKSCFYRQIQKYK